MKTCKDCGADKSESDFYKGQGECKECTKCRVAAYRIANIEKVQEYDRNRPNQKERAENNKLNYRKRISTPEGRMREWARAKANIQSDKRAASAMVANAICVGRLIKEPCSVCGSTERIHAHHEDYTKPLEVVWLCVKHHGERHRQINEERRQD